MPDTPDEAPNRPRPVARRAPAARKPPAPRTGWWWFALALTALMAMVLVGTVAWSASMAAAANARKSAPTGASRPPLPGPFDLGPTVGIPALPEDDGNPERVSAFFTRFGTAVRDPNGVPDELFDWTDLSAAVPEDAIEFPLAPDGTPQDANWYGRLVVQSELTVWKQWDWAKVNVRKVALRPDGTAIEAVVWHPTRDGRLVKRRWTLSEGVDGLRAQGWEDLRTGVTARDRAYARAASALSTSVRRQRQWQFDEVTQVHRLIDERKWEDASTLLDRLRTVRFDGELQYAIDLAEGRLAYSYRLSDEGEWDQDLAVEILEDLVAKHPERLASYLLLAEAHLLGEEYGRVIEVCDALLAVTDADPDALALRGAARYALVQPDDASADFLAALALDKHQPRAVNWQRQQAEAAGKKGVADTLATAPDPAALFDALVGWATAEADWPGVLALAERYRTLRPKDARWVVPLVTAHLREGRADAAVAEFKKALPLVPPADRPQVVRQIAWTMIDLELADRVYAAVPTADAPAAFRVLAEHYEVRRQRWVKTSDEATKPQREAAVKALSELIAAHRKVHPIDPRLALHDGRLKIDRAEFAKAAEVLAPAVARLTPTGDSVKDYESGYQDLFRELLLARYKCGQAVIAYRESDHRPEVFFRFIELTTTDRDADGLTRLLDERQAAGVEQADELYWRAEADRFAKRHAEAAKKYREYMKATGGDQFYLWMARTHSIRCLVRAGDVAAAEKEVTAATADVIPLELRALVLAKAGRPADAERVLRDRLRTQMWTGGLYADEDLGPVLRGPDFAAFRKDFPPPDDKPATPR